MPFRRQKVDTPGLYGPGRCGRGTWRDFLKHNPADPLWPNRDRFVLSNGHGSMLLYGLLHLTGYDVSLEDYDSFDNCMEGLQVTRNTASVQALRPPQDLWARDLQQRWVWRWQRKS